MKRAFSQTKLTIKQLGLRKSKSHNHLRYEHMPVLPVRPLSFKEKRNVIFFKQKTKNGKLIQDIIQDTQVGYNLVKYYDVTNFLLFLLFVNIMEDEDKYNRIAYIILVIIMTKAITIK
jgi:hypothetical protein